MEEELQTSADSALSPGLSDGDSGAVPVSPPPPADQSPPADNSKPPTPPVSDPSPPSPSSTSPSTSNSPDAPPPKQSPSSPPPPLLPPPDAAASKQPSPPTPQVSPPPPSLASNSPPPSPPMPIPSPPIPSSSNPAPSTTPSAPRDSSGQSLPPPPPSPTSPIAVFPPLSPTVSSQVNPTPSVAVPPPTPPANVDNPPVTETPSDSLTPPTLSQSPPLSSDSPPTSSNLEKPSTSTPSGGRPAAGHGSSLAAPKNSGSSSSSPSSDVSNGAGNSSHGTFIGVALAGAAIILVAIFFVISRKKKRRRLEGLAMHYKPPPSLSVRSDGYYYGQTNPMGNSLQFDTQYGSKPPMFSSGTGTFGIHGERLSYSGALEPIGMSSSKSHFTYEEIAEMTHGFSMQNLLGEGGFGCVYKGWLTDGRVVAVKQLKAGSGQGEREFRAEVEIISRVHHRHLVSLVGYCISDQHRSLVYEFVPNNTLEHHLHGRGRTTMDWPNRLKIAIGSARGLAYLHEDCHPRIIHRDIKSANILLDDSFDAQVADFGLAKLSNDTSTHVSTRVMGTFGYMAPEYASSGKLTDRSDVFSFGVVLLELITGRKPVDPSQPLGEESLVEWARPLLNEALQSGKYDELVDPKLESNYVKSEMFRMMEAAAACVRHSATKRPRMVQVVRALDSEGGLSDLSNGVKYGQSTIFDSSQYPSDIEQFRRMAFGSDSYSSDRSYTEYGATSTSKNSNNFSGDALYKPLNPARQNSEEYQSSIEFSQKDMNRRGGDGIPGGSYKYKGRGYL